MMILQYREKPPLVKGIEVASVSIQAGQIASMIGAESFSVHVAGGKATFKLNSSTDVTVETGQVVTLQGDQVVVYSREEFKSKFEPFSSFEPEISTSGA